MDLKNALALAYYFYFVGCAVQNGTWFVFAHAAVYHHIYQAAKPLKNQLGVGAVFVLKLGVVYRGSYNWVAELRHNAPGYGIVGYSDAHRTFFGGKQLRHLAARWQNKRKCARQKLLHQPKNVVGYLPCVLRQIAKIVANNRKIVLAFAVTHNSAYTLYGFFVEQVTTYGINGVGGVNNYAAVLQAIYDLLQLFLVVVVELYEHEFGFLGKQKPHRFTQKGETVGRLSWLG